MKMEQVLKIAKMKKDSLIAKDEKALVNQIIGTCVSVGCCWGRGVSMGLGCSVGRPSN